LSQPTISPSDGARASRHFDRLIRPTADVPCLSLSLSDRLLGVVA